MARSSGPTSVPLLYKALLGFFILLSIALAIALIIQSSKDSNDRDNANTSSFLSSCQSDLKQDTAISESPSVFQDLTSEEATAAREYLEGVAALNITNYNDAQISDNYIILIENYLPPKTEVLGHLDGNSPQPDRRARVIVVNGGKAVPDIEEYIVYPLSKPTTHERLKMTGYNYPASYNGIGWNIKESPFLDKIVMNISKTAERLLLESFGETLHKCNPSCISYVPSGYPGSFKNGIRSTWAIFHSKGEGYYYYTLPFEIRIDHSGTDPSKFKASMIVYNNQTFKSINELVEEYDKGLVKKIKTSKPTDEMRLRSSLHFRPDMTKQKPLEAPKVVEPSGRRYSIKGNRIEYMKWRFDTSVRPSNGIGLFDIRYNNKRIIYELSVQDLFVSYSGAMGKQSAAAYSDTSLGIASFAFELIPGVDCPETASYMDSGVFFNSEQLVPMKRSICVFEYDTGIPLRRHREFKYFPTIEPWFFGGVPGKALMVRMISTPFNYDYIFDFIFYQNGVIESRTSASGYLRSTYFMNAETEFGFQTFENNIGTIHDHFVLYKADIDIEGIKNSYQTLDVVPKNVSYRWEEGTYRVAKTVQKNKKMTEKEAVLHYNFDRPKYMMIQNDVVKNRFGNPKGYRIIPQSMVKQVYPEDYPITKSTAWTKYQLAITKEKENERFGYCIYNQFGMEDPSFNFDALINDDDNIVNQDLVAWISLGGLHIPNTEDVPNTFTTGNSYSFLLKPYGYFEEDQSTSSIDSVFIGKDSKGKMRKSKGTDTCALK